MSLRKREKKKKKKRTSPTSPGGRRDPSTKKKKKEKKRKAEDTLHYCAKGEEKGGKEATLTLHKYLNNLHMEKKEPREEQGHTIRWISRKRGAKNQSSTSQLSAKFPEDKGGHKYSSFACGTRPAS